MSTFRRRALGVALFVAGWLVAEPRGHADGQESLRGRAILDGKVLVLVADVHGCAREATIPAAQLFVSQDGGLTWVKRGPALEGVTLEYAHVAVDGAWLVGLHTAEGPGVDPFLMVPTADGQDWVVRKIADVPAELRGAAVRGTGEALVWVRPLDDHGQAFSRSVTLYKSSDRGTSWTATRARVAPKGLRGASFVRLTTRSHGWRLIDRRDGGFDLERRVARTWRLVKAFPWHPCS